MTRFALTVEFDGRPFMGWQRQDHGPSVQQAIEEAAFAVTGEKVVVHAAGRTDAGVHGLGMRAHLDIGREITPFRLMEALNARLRPHPVAILACVGAPSGVAGDRFAGHFERGLLDRLLDARPMILPLPAHEGPPVILHGKCEPRQS